MRGFGSPGYTNANYPFKREMPRILNRDTGDEDYNPVTSYRRTFTIPECWQGRRIILRFDGVYSAYYVWVNGKKVGYAEDSCLPSEFDITEHLMTKGTNVLAVEVYRWSDGSYLEDQDMFRYSGIFRDVTLWSMPKEGIWDFAANVKCKIEKGKCFGAELSLYGIRGEWTATLYDAERKAVGTIDSRQSTLALRDVRLWSAENPYLYVLVVRKGDDIRMRRIGFREIKVDGTRILVNGQPVKFKGVNRHETNPDNGRTVSLEDMLRDVTLMKRYNIDTVRTSHYPDHHLWYDLCSISWGAKYPRVCSYAVLDDSANGRRFAFANTHTDHKSEEAREKGMLLVIERMKDFAPGAPIVLTGDHNCLEYEAPAVAVSKILKDSMYLSETTPEGSWRTFNFWSYKEKELSIAEALRQPVDKRSVPGDKSDQKRIDYIYVSPGTRVLGYRTIPDTRPGVKLYPSDHFPSVAEIVIGATPAEPCVVEAPGSAKLVFDTSNAPDLRAWTEGKFAPAMCEWVVTLTEIMASDGWEPPKEILFQFVFERLQSCTNAAAWASTWKNTVNLRVDWFRKNLDGEALGATVHELTHIMQGYWSKKGRTNENCPSWASEGYADYIRWILFEPEADGCGYIRKNPKKYHYNDSYRVTAHFFGFVESQHPGTMKKLNAALRDHTFDNGKFWQDATGKPVETLEADWKASIK